MICFRSRVRHAWHKPWRPGIADSGARKLLFWSALFLLTVCVACGRPKAKVKAPAPTPASPPQAAAKKSAGTQAAPAPTRLPKAAPPAEVPAVALPQADITPPSSEAVTGPMIRIGLRTAAKELRISSSESFYIMEKIPEAAQKQIRGDIELRIERGQESAGVVYQIQVGSFSKPETARELQDTLSRKLKVPVAIRENSATGTHQVRIGEFAEKDEAQEHLPSLREEGYPDAFIVREETASGNGKAVLALRGSDGVFQISSAGFLILPSSASGFLCLDGKPYRGLFDVFMNKSGRITLVNQLGVEDYLPGVVPVELSPTSFPEYEALAAQSIAARTYALKNMGRYRTEGFDLSDDTRTQVYGGVSVENPVTNDVVRRTSGIAIYYQNKLIDAMFMSTCGGRTEDFANVYDTLPVPYLQSVFCSIEHGSEKGEILVEGTHELTEPFLAEDGSLANRNLELARIIKLIPAAAEAAAFSETIQPSEAERWIKTAGDLARFHPAQTQPAAKDLDTRSGFMRHAAETIFGVDEIRRKISPGDAAYYMATLDDGDRIPEGARAPLSYLMQKGLWRPDADNRMHPEAPMRRGDAIFLLQRWIESARPEILRKGTFMQAAASESAASDAADSGNGKSRAAAIKIKSGSKTQEFPLAPNPLLFRMDPGRITPVQNLRLIGAEKVAFHVDRDGMIDFMEVELNPAGASSDRYSPSSTWNTTLTRTAVAEKLRSLAGNIGELRDLRPHRLGNSGRVIQIQAVGSRKSVVLNGYKVRGALGLRDTLFTLTREFGADGTVARFAFSGRGFGHGIGLCQVGAFGMAKAGRSYEEILKTYYKGVDIRKAY